MYSWYAYINDDILGEKNMATGHRTSRGYHLFRAMVPIYD